MRLGAVLYDNFELLDAYGPLEMFGCLGDDLDIVVIAQHKGPVKSSGGPATLAEYDFSDAPPLDLLLLPGGVGTIPELANPLHLTKCFFPWRAVKATRYIGWNKPAGSMPVNTSLPPV